MQKVWGQDEGYYFTKGFLSLFLLWMTAFIRTLKHIFNLRNAHLNYKLNLIAVL